MEYTCHYKSVEEEEHEGTSLIMPVFFLPDVQMSRCPEWLRGLNCCETIENTYDCFHFYSPVYHILNDQLINVLE